MLYPYLKVKLTWFITEPLFLEYHPLSELLWHLPRADSPKCGCKSLDLLACSSMIFCSRDNLPGVMVMERRGVTEVALVLALVWTWVCACVRVAVDKARVGMGITEGVDFLF